MRGLNSDLVIHAKFSLPVFRLFIGNVFEVCFRAAAKQARAMSFQAQAVLGNRQ